MAIERGPRPGRQRLEAVVVGRLTDAHVEAQLTPGHQLVQKRLGRRGDAPPSLAGAQGPGARRPEPSLARHQPREHLPRRDVAEVQERGEAAAGVELNLVAFRGVAREVAFEKGLEQSSGGQRPAPHLCWTHGVVDWQPFEAHLPVEQCVRGRPIARRDSVQHRRRHIRKTVQRLGQRRSRHAGPERTLQMATEGIGGGEHPTGWLAHRQQPVAVDGLDCNVESRRRAGGHRRQHERGVVVGHHHARPRGQGVEQAHAGVWRGLDPGEICDATAAGQRGTRVRHPVEDEPVQAIAGPPVVEPQRLVDDQGHSELGRPFDGPLEREAPAGPACRDHPIEDPVAAGANRRVVEGANAYGGDARRHRKGPETSGTRTLSYEGRAVTPAKEPRPLCILNISSRRCAKS